MQGAEIGEGLGHFAVQDKNREIIKNLRDDIVKCLESMKNEMDSSEEKVSKNARIRFLSTFMNQIVQNFYFFKKIEGKEEFNRLIDEYQKITSSVDISEVNRKSQINKIKNNIKSLLISDQNLCGIICSQLIDGLTKDTVKSTTVIGFVGDYREIAHGLIPTSEEIPSGILSIIESTIKQFKKNLTDEESLKLIIGFIIDFNEEFSKDSAEGKLKFTNMDLRNQAKVIIDFFSDDDVKKHLGIKEEKDTAKLYSFLGNKQEVNNRIRKVIDKNSEGMLAPLSSWDLTNLFRYSKFMTSGRGRAKQTEHLLNESPELVELPPEIGRKKSYEEKQFDHGGELTGHRNKLNIMQTSAQLYKDNKELAFYAAIMTGKDLGSKEVNSFILMNKDKDLVITDDFIEIVKNKLLEKASDQKNIENTNDYLEQLNTMKGKRLTEVNKRLQNIAVNVFDTSYIQIANSFGYNYRSGASGHTGHIIPIGLDITGFLIRNNQKNVYELKIENAEQAANYATFILDIIANMEKVQHHSYEEVLGVVWLLQNAGKQNGIEISKETRSFLPKIDLGDMPKSLLEFMKVAGVEPHNYPKFLRDLESQSATVNVEHKEQIEETSPLDTRERSIGESAFQRALSIETPVLIEHNELKSKEEQENREQEKISVGIKVKQ